MLLIELIALILVIAGIVVLVRYNTWGGIALIAVGVLVFLLRSQIDSGSNTNAGAMVLPFISKRFRDTLTQ